MRQLSAYLGDFVKHMESETVYQCLQCGKPKLYVSPAGRWYCFRCQVGGKHLGTEEVSTKVRRTDFSWPIKCDPVTESVRSISLGTLQRTCCQYHHGIVVPLTANERIVGSQTYQAELEPRYRTRGIRGIAIARTPWTGVVIPNVYLFEGMFDWLTCLDTSVLGTYVFLAGNQLTDVQFLALRRYLDQYQIIHICFDNDLLKPAVLAARRLETYFEQVHLLLPPDGVKDWDEAGGEKWKEATQNWRKS